jgi:hypothetical protein
VLGIVSLSVAVFALAWFITAGTASVAALASLLAAIGSSIVFMVAERRASDPMFDFSVYCVSAASPVPCSTRRA